MDKPTDAEAILARADREVSDDWANLDDHAHPLERAILGLRNTLIDCTSAIIESRRG